MIPWMSVEEELPEKKGRYFCCMQRGNHEKKGFMILLFDPEAKQFRSNDNQRFWKKSKGFRRAIPGDYFGSVATTVLYWVKAEAPQE